MTGYHSRRYTEVQITSKYEANIEILQKIKYYIACKNNKVLYRTQCSYEINC